MFKPYYIYTKCGDFNLEKEFRDAKIDQIIKWSIVRIFEEAEPP